jgi:hypothetical protein
MWEFIVKRDSKCNYDVDHSPVLVWLRHDMTMSEYENPQTIKRTIKKDGTRYVHFMGDAPIGPMEQRM